MLLAGEFTERKNLLKEDREMRKKMESRLVPGLPVDADPPMMRRSQKTIKNVVESLLKEALTEKCPFFDNVCEKWMFLFPELPAKPVAWTEGKLILAVPNSGQLFSVRSKLAKIKKVLKELPGAPARLTVHFKIQSAVFK